MEFITRKRGFKQSARWTQGCAKLGKSHELPAATQAIVQANSRAIAARSEVIQGIQKPRGHHQDSSQSQRLSFEHRLKRSQMG